jgi:lipopolysaccharide heptosyltransferase II
MYWDWIGLVGRALRPLVRQKPPPDRPGRVLIVKPCCIGDVILATPLLACLRRAWPQATIDWLIDDWSIQAVQHHPALNNVLSAPRNLGTLAARMASYDLLVVPDRSPRLGMAAWLARVPTRAGLDSAGRGFAYTVRARVDPAQVRHEAEIYLDVGRALGLGTDGCQASFEPTEEHAQRVANKLDLSRPFVTIHPAGGDNPTTKMPIKRWPVKHFAALAERCATHLGLKVMVLGGPGDSPITAEVLRIMRVPAIDLTGQLNLGEVGALARRATLYVGNDTGISHVAAAAGGRVLMIFGPSDPRRYGPFASPGRARHVWRPIELPGGVSAGPPSDFDWERDGVTVEEAWYEVQTLLGAPEGHWRASQLPKRA